ncbi:hypothetical protein F5Y19DRAFT_26718 [Xylariaceae sp. FL1651]|nr:hypothetical protein F5Y19DRAFT_26718 [Xylariaceae sp. FL1651]
MPRKVMMFVGAPESSTLDWREPQLYTGFLSPFVEFAHLEAELEQSFSQPEGSANLDAAVWRAIPLSRERLATGFSQTYGFRDPYHGDADFFTTFSTQPNTTVGSTDDRASQSLLANFYDHSLAIHDELPSSQLPASTLSTNESSVDISGDSTTNLSTQRSRSSLLALPIQVGHLSDLEDLPNARYLESISPQTMTVNLIVGIISIAEPRKVMTRWGSTRSLVEIIVGDDTKSGFNITFWLSSDSDQPGSLLKDLRRQDIILLRNVALSVFTKKVHGHSLRKGLTKIDLLHRRRLDEGDKGGLYSMKDVSSTTAAHPQLEKTRKVREWVLNFVSDGGISLKNRKQHHRLVRRWDMPPEDTQ